MENLHALRIERTNSGRKQTLQFFRLPLVVMDHVSHRTEIYVSWISCHLTPRDILSRDQKKSANRASNAKPLGGLCPQETRKIVEWCGV